MFNYYSYAKVSFLIESNPQLLLLSVVSTILDSLLL